MTHFKAFSVLCNISDPFPISECSLGCFVAYLTKKGLSPQSMQMYWSAVRDTQIAMGFLDPREHSSLPVLGRVQAGIGRLRATERPRQQWLRLPITLTVLRSIRDQLDYPTQTERELVWAVASMAFFRFFRLGELLPDNKAAYAKATHLSWGEVATDRRYKPTIFSSLP